MDKKFLGWIAFEPDFPIWTVLEEVADFQNELAAEGYVTYVTYATAGERVSSVIGLVFTTEPVTDEEAQEAFDEFLRKDQEE